MVIPAPSFPIGVLLNFLPIERLRGGGARQSNAELVSGVCMQIHCLPFLAILSADTKNCSFILRKVNSYIQYSIVKLFFCSLLNIFNIKYYRCFSNLEYYCWTLKIVSRNIFIHPVPNNM